MNKELMFKLFGDYIDFDIDNNSSQYVLLKLLDKNIDNFEQKEYAYQLEFLPNNIDSITAINKEYIDMLKKKHCKNQFAMLILKNIEYSDKKYNVKLFGYLDIDIRDLYFRSELDSIYKYIKSMVIYATELSTGVLLGTPAYSPTTDELIEFIEAYNKSFKEEFKNV